MTSLLLGLSLAHATPSFDPTTWDQVFSGFETFTSDQSTQLWAAIERQIDHDATLFGPSQFNSVTAWPDDSPFMPFIADCFGTSEPESGAFLLHVGLGAQVATGTPVLFVPGAGDNASRGFVIMALDFAARGRPVYGITFSHPHGDVFEQAEIIADAIARIRQRTGAAQVDLVSHSKGGIASAIYLSNAPGTSWPDADYMAVGTPYQHDVRRAVFIATPLHGIDSAWRWPGMNFAGLEADSSTSPTSWDNYYPAGTLFPLNKVSLSDQDFFKGGGDLFPGQRQIIHPQDAPLPGSLPWLGAYATLQQDWYTTWHGGTGFVSDSRGIEAAEHAGGDIIPTLGQRGVDPAVELFVLAGTSPLLTNGTFLLADQMFDGVWVDIVSSTIEVWSTLVATIIEHTLPDLQISEADLQGLAGGKLILGEITAPSDGLVMLESATWTDSLTARGAEVKEIKVVELAHLDLLYSNPVTAVHLREQVELDPVEYGWTLGLADRYEAADTVGWLGIVLADPGGPGDTDVPADDTDAGPQDDLEPPEVLAGCECGHTGSTGGLALAAALLIGPWRRRRSSG